MLICPKNISYLPFAKSNSFLLFTPRMTTNNNEPNTAKESEAQYLQMLEKGANISVDYGEIGLPEWYDDAKYRRAQEFFKRNFYAMFVGKLCGLLAIVAVPTILRVLVHTNQSSEPKTAYRRYIATIFHTLEWYYEEMVPSSRAWRSVTYVRKAHAGVSRHASGTKPGMIISQKDMAVTQFGFIGCVIISHRMLGVQYDREDLEAFVHFWRVIGHMMGIEERFNACTNSFDTTEQRMLVIANGILRPALLNHTAQFVEMGKALIEGLWCFNPFIEFDSFLFLTMRLINIPGYHYWPSDTVQSAHDFEQSPARYEQIKGYARFVLFCVCYIHSVLLPIAIFRWYFNSQMLLSRFLITYFPFLAFYQFGIQDSYVRILK
ncbi:rubber oxygenase-like isoform X2 [Anopheles bellator]|uniref:rubber oxygenase-like isoform X2 n=1 Tax=Anopheles bellator TaxID=139047 RepID=UPI002647A5EE|nr:rubber oxygenase-like isoform X2 [Anopheles bellator]